MVTGARVAKGSLTISGNIAVEIGKKGRQKERLIKSQ